MRVFARISYALAVLALASPAAWAQSHAPGHAAAGPKAKSKRSWFGRAEYCAECQMAAARAKDGAYVPPPPPLPGAAPTGHACAACGNQKMVLTTTGPMSVVQGQQAAAGGYMYAPDDTPGFASTDGGPAPVGEYRPQMANIPMPGAPVGGGLRDPSVGMSNYSPPALIPAGANRPRILSHLTGISGIGRDWRESRDRRREESHAAIRFGAPNEPVTDLPARMVYGR